MSKKLIQEWITKEIDNLSKENANLILKDWKCDTELSISMRLEKSNACKAKIEAYIKLLDYIKELKGTKKQKKVKEAEKIDLSKHELPIEGHLENDEFYTIDEYVEGDEFPYKGEIMSIDGCSSSYGSWNVNGKCEGEKTSDYDIQTTEQDDRNDRFLR